MRQEGKEQKLPSSISLHKLPAEDVVQVKSVSSCLKVRVKGKYPLTLKVYTRNEPTHFKLSKNTLLDVPSISKLQLISDIVRRTTKNSHLKENEVVD